MTNTNAGDSCGWVFCEQMEAPLLIEGTSETYVLAKAVTELAKLAGR